MVACGRVPTNSPARFHRGVSRDPSAIWLRFAIPRGWPNRGGFVLQHRTFDRIHLASFCPFACMSNYGGFVLRVRTRGPRPGGFVSSIAIRGAQRCIGLDRVTGRLREPRRPHLLMALRAKRARRAALTRNRRPGDQNEVVRQILLFRRAARREVWAATARGGYHHHA